MEIRTTLEELPRHLQSFNQPGATPVLLVVDESENRECSPVRPETKPLRPYGLCAGEFTIPEDFDEPLPEEILGQFEGP